MQRNLLIGLVQKKPIASVVVHHAEEPVFVRDQSGQVLGDVELRTAGEQRATIDERGSSMRHGLSDDFLPVRLRGGDFDGDCVREEGTQHFAVGGLELGHGGLVLTNLRRQQSVVVVCTAEAAGSVDGQIPRGGDFSLRVGGCVGKKDTV